MVGLVVRDFSYIFYNLLARLSSVILNNLFSIVIQLYECRVSIGKITQNVKMLKKRNTNRSTDKIKSVASTQKTSPVQKVKTLSF